MNKTSLVCIILFFNFLNANVDDLKILLNQIRDKNKTESELINEWQNTVNNNWDSIKDKFSQDITNVCNRVNEKHSITSLISPKGLSRILSVVFERKNGAKSYIKQQEIDLKKIFSLRKEIAGEKDKLFTQACQILQSDRMYDSHSSFIKSILTKWWLNIKQQVFKSVTFCNEHKKSVIGGSLIALYSTVWAKIKYVRYQLEDKNWVKTINQDLIDKYDEYAIFNKSHVYDIIVSKLYPSLSTIEVKKTGDRLPYLMVFMQQLSEEEHYVKQYLSLYRWLSTLHLINLFPGQFNTDYIEDLQAHLEDIETLQDLL